MPMRPGAAYMALAPLVAAFALSQFYRSSQAVLAPLLSVELSLSPAEIGLVAGAFHVVFAALQIPVGLMLDRYGARKTVGATLLLAALGAWVFARADGLWGLLLGQGLIGAGCSAAFMGALVVAARWFAADRFAAISGGIISFSMAGVLASATPLAALVTAIGWRATYDGLAVATVAVAALNLALVRDAPPGHAFHDRRPEGWGDIAAGLRAVLAHRRLPYLLAVAFTAYPALLTVRGLWAGPYLVDVFELSTVAAGNVLLFMAMAMVIGPSLFGQAARRWSTGRLITLGALASATVLLALALVGPMTLIGAAVLLVAQGLVGCYAVLVYTEARRAFPEALVGRAMTTVNLAVFVGVFVLQGLTGAVLSGFTPGAAIGYGAVFALLAGVVAVAGAAFAWGSVRRRTQTEWKD